MFPKGLNVERLVLSVVMMRGNGLLRVGVQWEFVIVLCHLLSGTRSFDVISFSCICSHHCDPLAMRLSASQIYASAVPLNRQNHESNIIPLVGYLISANLP